MGRVRRRTDGERPAPPPRARTGSPTASSGDFARSELDLAGHVNNAAYLTPVEEELLQDAEPESIDIEIEYRSPAQAGEITRAARRGPPVDRRPRTARPYASIVIAPIPRQRPHTDTGGLILRAVVIPEPGDPDVLEVVDRPARKPGAGEVRIAVKAAAVNPTDIGLRQRGGGRPRPAVGSGNGRRRDRRVGRPGRRPARRSGMR